ncbi:hypothetical protein [Clostridium tetani]|uniref:hypothetical protein n=1 Tax=Clostridium tetani TaxID=1513 RepID=UPI0005139158|nr:hypothetical protein [Clostridium tetani]KGI36858.1 hypothetical protein LA33_12055 [Clostridium tetani ATCC 9441]KGI41535.1 hypothetical protein KY55_13870 [Clostridium tetani]RXI67869.1 hypothetical protein DP127_13790 [Clostridium tetani]SUY82433.1 Uncharacterised protein [Clostridium tetani]BDR77059.1 hypothetical protein K154306013_p11100 [Clostridium tetani]
MLNDILKHLKSISKVCEYLLDPSKLFSSLWNWTVDVSYTLFLSIAFISFILYLIGHKKMAKFVTTSIVLYAFIQAIGKVAVQ